MSAALCVCYRYERVIKKESLEDEPCCQRSVKRFTQILSKVLFILFKWMGNVLPNFPWVLVPECTHACAPSDGRRGPLFWILSAIDFIEPLGFLVNAAGTPLSPGTPPPRQPLVVMPLL